MNIPKPMIKCCRWCCRTNIIALIWAYVVLLFHKCLRLLRLGLYTVSTLRVNNGAVIVAHICYISLLRCNNYHEYLACEEEYFCEWHTLVEGDWELLSGERLIILLKIAQLQLNGSLETKPVPKQSHLVYENKSITFMAESSSVSKTIKFQIFQKCFENVQLFSVDPIKFLNVYADS